MPPQVTRLIIIFGLLLIAFVVGRKVLRPNSFGEYGHYRGKALPEAVAHQPQYVARASCAECHDEEAVQNAAGPHKRISCQTCHGTGAAHVADPTTANITKPEARAACLRCHEAQAARPKWFAQIVEKEHADGALCGECHVVHNPAEIK